MTRKLPFSTVDHSLATKYLQKALGFKADAQSMSELADQFSGNGIAVLCIHSAIAYGDAIAILVAGKKSKSGDHRDAAAFLASVVAIRTVQDKAAMRAFQAILNRKDEVSYADEIVRESDAAALLERLDIRSLGGEYIRRYQATPDPGTVVAP